MSRLERKYFINQDGSEDTIITSIDCYEKILYHALRDHDVDYKTAFCDDINLCVRDEKDKFRVYKNKLHLNDSLYTVNKYKPNSKIALMLINEMIDKNIIVAVRTMFDMLSPYHWYKQKNKIGVSNTHYCLLVDYDDKNYYFVDDPGMLHPGRLVSYPQNPTVGIISKQELSDALEVFCEVLTVEINTEQLPYIDNFEIVRKEIVNNYYISNKSQDSQNLYIGKESLEQLIILFENGSNLSDIIKDNFLIYLMYTSRSIFQWCIEDNLDLFYNKEIILENLHESIRYWELLHSILVKHTIKPYPHINGVVINSLKEIIELEDKLMESLAK